MNYFQDNEEDEAQIEEAEEVIDNDTLISNLIETNRGSKETITENVLLPDLQTESTNQLEPNYDEMDNVTLLSSLCIQNNSPSDLHLPDFN